MTSDGGNSTAEKTVKLKVAESLQGKKLVNKE